MSKGLEDYYQETYEKCEVYGFDRIKNLKAFCIAVAEELAAKKKPVPIENRRVSDEEIAELRKKMETLGGDL